MFKAHYKNGITITEKEMTWDEIPNGIVSLQLTQNMTLKIRDSKTGNIIEKPPPDVTIGKYDAYYFDNEAMATVLTLSDGQMIEQGQPIRTAQIIGGIDKKRGIVIQVRVDKFANVSINHFPLEKLKRKIESIKQSN